jgi:hypothetical protein
VTASSDISVTSATIGAAPGGELLIDREAWAAAIDASAACAQACVTCADACLDVDGGRDLGTCVAVSEVCAELCRTTAASLSRIGHAAALPLHHLLVACIDACERCAAECEHHDDLEHCRRCADACRRCAEACTPILRAVPS